MAKTKTVKHKLEVDFGGSLAGGILASVLSWMTWHSIGWSIVAFILNWFYVIYWTLCVWPKHPI